MRIHPAAQVSPGAELGKEVEVGPFAVIGEHVQVGDHCRIGPQVVVAGHTQIGEHCSIHPFATIGTPPQDLKYRGEPTRLVIGAHNVIREYSNLNVGTDHGGGVTTVGDHNLIMAYSHIAHDCHVGSHTILANAATLGGHVTVGDYATIGAFSGVHQFCRVGRHAFIGGYSVVTKDALPFMKTVGNRARVYGVNSIGLRRRGFDEQGLERLRHAYRILFQSRLNTSQAVARLKDEMAGCGEVDELIRFIATSRRGVIKR
jgi:UDP-N-acetylglucosamine acyltransferase